MRVPCLQCGGPKGPGRSRRLCDTCKATRSLRCARCEGPKPGGQGRRLCETCEPKGGSYVPGIPGPCRRCGSRENKLRGKQLCEDCRELAEWRNQRRSKVRRPRQPCELCGRVKPPGRGRLYCEACVAERARPRSCQRCAERPVRHKLAKLCWQCHAVAQASNRAKKSERGRVRWAQGNVNPAGRRNLGRKREVSRMAYRLRAERDGRAVAPVIVSDLARGPAISGRQLAAAIDAVVERDRNFRMAGSDPNNVSKIGVVCERIGLVEREVFRWRMGEGNPTLTSVDLVLTRLGLMWWDVWTEENVRIPIFVVRTYRWRKNRGGRCLIKVRTIPYGDLGPDVVEMRRIEALMAGEPIPVAVAA